MDVIEAEIIAVYYCFKTIPFAPDLISLTSSPSSNEALNPFYKEINQKQSTVKKKKEDKCYVILFIILFSLFSTHQNKTFQTSSLVPLPISEHLLLL